MNAPFAPSQGTGQPVRRESLDVDDPRAQVFRPVDGGIAFVERYLEAIEAWADQIKRAGKQHEINANAIRVLKALLRRCMDFKTGTCEPCLDTLMRLTRLARRTVTRALATLRKHGFLDWIRRTVRTDNPPGEGPQVRQVSNAYWIDLGRLPKRVFEYLAAKMRKKGVTVERKPRQPIFAGRWKAKRAAAQNARAQRWRDASPQERAAMLEPGNPAAQAELLDAWASPPVGRAASSAGGLNPPRTTLSGKE